MSGQAGRQVPDQVLRWLHSSLQNNYHDVNRTYQDVANALAATPTLSPKTDIYTFENGSSALLLQLFGTLPVDFRGTEYRFPVTIWISHSYPREAPYAFVSPIRDMAVRPGQHVSVEGRIYHPYLAQWAKEWAQSTLIGLFTVLRDVFAKEPPVVARQQMQQSSFHRPAPLTPKQISSPSLPQGVLRQSERSSLSSPAPPGPYSHPQNAAPRLPPKGPQEIPRPPSASQSSTTGPPPRPPKGDSSSRGAISPPLPLAPHQMARPPSHTFQSAPPPSADPRHPHAQPIHASQYSQFPAYPPNTASPPFQSQYGISSPPPPQDFRQGPPNPPPPGAQWPPQTHPNNAPPVFQQVQVPAPPKPAPALDLMSSPLDMTLPSQMTGSGHPAPPIPPNPEKDALLSSLSDALTQQIAESVQKNQEALPALQAQHAAMLAAQNAMQAELQSLKVLEATAIANETTLRASMQDAERAVRSASERQLPNLDDVLVAPTVVGEQLYDLVAEQKAIDAGLFALANALDRGRLSGDVFVRHTRALAREAFLKKALTRKVAMGMGLTIDSGI